MTIGRCQALADAWYHDRLSPDFHRRTVEGALVIFAELGLTGRFWSFDGADPVP